MPIAGSLKSFVQPNVHCRSLSIAEICFHMINRTKAFDCPLTNHSSETATNLESSIKMVPEPMLIEVNNNVWTSQNHSAIRAPRLMSIKRRNMKHLRSERIICCFWHLKEDNSTGIWTASPPQQDGRFFCSFSRRLYAVLTLLKFTSIILVRSLGRRFLFPYDHPWSLWFAYDHWDRTTSIPETVNDRERWWALESVSMQSPSIVQDYWRPTAIVTN